MTMCACWKEEEKTVGEVMWDMINVIIVIITSNEITTTRQLIYERGEELAESELASCESDRRWILVIIIKVIVARME